MEYNNNKVVLARLTKKAPVENTSTGAYQVLRNKLLSSV